MPIPDFIVEIRRKIGTDPLWLPGVKAVVTRENQGTEVLLVQRADNGKWTLPAGILEPGEEPAVGCVREVLEETGIEARVTKLAGIATTDLMVYPNGDQAQYLDIIFALEYVSGIAHVADDENLAVQWSKVDDLPADCPPKHRRAIEWALDNSPAPKFVT
ncbi:8-oxo-dGTP pyrophosphatase MutT (NUDIX family) [Neomicrococcus aestuarii]|uniref:8-oxo-dGTP pyrophosphatase MutT (NUDIX family) n=1 Tax=Neomicrococcus aestuarii TaxID=556325 RepID=A0A7W8WYN7_9MICC|nr:NUDIX domain-containing protein [Neomicrococcus aestuarii]MBB5511387.1 8-oxo-dGTP pyrophosphatase MutT (NUDIX family) [Neomicrococcus aestuarii]